MKQRIFVSSAIVFCAATAALILSACPSDPCANAPSCQNGKALNCETSCHVGPCSNGPEWRQCSSASTCEVVPGDGNSQQFFRSRAACILNSTDVCDPATAPKPTCDRLGTITGCSGYHVVMEQSCSQAALYFVDFSCCSGPADAGTRDGGAPDAGDGGL